MIPYKNRFHHRSSLKYVYAKGEVVRSRFITLKAVKNSKNKESRIAVVISKKTLKSAVRRNRVRRRIYGYLNGKIKDLNQVYDVALIVTSSEVLSLPSKELREQIDNLFNQANLYK